MKYDASKNSMLLTTNNMKFSYIKLYKGQYVPQTLLYGFSFSLTEIFATTKSYLRTKTGWKFISSVKQFCAMITLTKQDENRSPEKWGGKFKYSKM